MDIGFMRDYEGKYKSAIIAKQARYARKLRDKVYNAYGGRCACCGEDTPEFLCIDHVKNDGNVERKLHGLAGVTLYNHIIKQKYPKKYQLLCWNCNMGKAHWGECPHKDALVRKPRHKPTKVPDIPVR